MGVNVEKCSGCGGLFQFLARGVCSPCLEHRESEFAVVRDWVRDNPGSSIGRASDATEIDEGRIAAWVREGRLERYGLNQKSAEEQREDTIAAAGCSPAWTTRRPSRWTAWWRPRRTSGMA